MRHCETDTERDREGKGEPLRDFYQREREREGGREGERESICRLSSSLRQREKTVCQAERERERPNADHSRMQSALVRLRPFAPIITEMRPNFAVKHCK